MNKKTFNLIKNLSKEERVYIKYRTNYSSGVLTISSIGFVELYKKINRLFKKVLITDIFYINEHTNRVYWYADTLEEAKEKLYDNDLC